MQLSSNTGLRSRAKFIMGGASILAAVGYLFFSSTKANAEYFMHVEQLTARDAGLLGQNPWISRVVVGKTMHSQFIFRLRQFSRGQHYDLYSDSQPMTIPAIPRTMANDLYVVLINWEIISVSDTPFKVFTTHW
jgi:CcmE